VAERNGIPLSFVEGERLNIKITTPEDYYIMQGILQARENAQIYGLDEGVN
jgi:2-C-methyl-D-erythritol 4-phosphate cytidylyltransferase